MGRHVGSGFRLDVENPFSDRKCLDYIAWLFRASSLITPAKLLLQLDGVSLNPELGTRKPAIRHTRIYTRDSLNEKVETGYFLRRSEQPGADSCMTS